MISVFGVSTEEKWMKGEGGKEERRIKMESYLSTLHIFRKYWTGLAFGNSVGV